ncbi:MAG: helix-turn-helix domain-containing protein [Candidatus Fermentibacteria bacterium]
MSNSLEYLLMELGLSGLEAEAYLAVLAEPDSTGYRISQVLGKPAPNTYKALDSLVIKGVILADESSRSRTFVAVPVREQVIQRSHRLNMLADEIEERLENIRKPRSEEGLYKLTTVHQVFARAQEMIENAQETIIADADNLPMKHLSDGFLRAASRGVKVLLHGREPMSMPGCEFISSVTEGWQGDMLVLITDSREYLTAFMSSDMRSVTGAVWSRNIIANCLYRSYMIKALFYRISMMIGEEGNSLEDIRAELLRLWDKWGYSDPGKEALEKVLRKSDD